MTRASTPALICDGKDGECLAEDFDLFTRGVSSVQTGDGTTTIISKNVPAPGWISVDDNDYCPDCALAVIHP